MAEFNWTVDDIKRAQRDFSNNFMRLDCIRTESYDVAIDCMTECIEKKAAAVQPVKHGYWEEVTDYGGLGDTHYRCSVCGEEWYLEDGKPKDNNMNFCPRCGSRMEGDTE